MKFGIKLLKFIKSDIFIRIHNKSIIYYLFVLFDLFDLLIYKYSQMLSKAEINEKQ
jgi:hypothetical protein